MDPDEALTAKLRAAGYDISRLIDSERVEVFDLARRVGIELWSPGSRWPSSEGADRTGGAITRIAVDRS